MAAIDMCGIVLDNGRDCPGYVHPDSPINLCAEHYREAFEWHRLNTFEATEERFTCPYGHEEGRPGIRGFKCEYCAWQTPDFLGALPQDGSEELARRQAIEAQEVPRASVVYYLRFGDRIKIGTSTNFRNRKKSIPHDEVLALEHGDQRLEHKRHAEFSEDRLVGEWFKSSPRLLKHIAALQQPEGWARQLRALEGKSW